MMHCQLLVSVGLQCLIILFIEALRACTSGPSWATPIRYPLAVHVALLFILKIVFNRLNVTLALNPFSPVYYSRLQIQDRETTFRTPPSLRWVITNIDAH